MIFKDYHDFTQNPSNGKDPLPSLKQGIFCCAQFTEDDAWYRARITEMKTQGDTPQAHVIYVDFGNNEILPVSRLRMLRREHAELPMIAVLCALDGALPTGGVRKELIPFPPMNDSIQNFSSQYWYNIKQKSDENMEKYQLSYNLLN